VKPIRYDKKKQGWAFQKCNYIFINPTHVLHRGNALSRYTKKKPGEVFNTLSNSTMHTTTNLLSLPLSIIQHVPFTKGVHIDCVLEVASARTYVSAE
jgi:hypothetical protein